MKPIPLAICLGSVALASTVIIQDTTFPTSNWSVLQVVNRNLTSVTSTPTPSLVNGNPNEYRDETHSMVGGSGSYTGAGWFNGYTPTSYAFSSILDTVDISFDWRHFQISPIVGYRYPVWTSSMTLGYKVVNSFTNATSSPSAQSGIDNFTVAVTSAVPEHSTYALFGASLLALSILRRRQQ